MTARPLRVSAFAVPLSGNKGSASMFLGLRDSFLAAGVEAEFAVFSYYYERDSKIAESFDGVTVHRGHPKELAFGLLPRMVLRAIVPSYRGGSYAADLSAMRDTDIVVLVGGTTFADSMLYKVPWNVLAALPAIMLGKPMVFLSQTMGPLKSLSNRVLARWTLKRASQVHGRGDTSTDYIRGIGLEAETWPDLSFPMVVPPIAQVEADHDVVADIMSRIRAAGRPVVAFTPNSIVYSKAKKAGLDYVDFLQQSMRYVAEQGYTPLLIPHSYREVVDSGEQHNNDRWLCGLVQEKTADIALYLEADLDSRELRALIGETTFVVASRFHSMVSALAMGVPPLTYGWGGHKYTEVLAQFDVTELGNSYNDLDLESFKAAFQRVVDDQDSLRERITRALPGVLERNAELPALLTALRRP